MTNIKIILASGSPRRKELLAQAGYDFDVVFLMKILNLWLHLNM